MCHTSFVRNSLLVLVLTLNFYSLFFASAVDCTPKDKSSFCELNCGDFSLDLSEVTKGGPLVDEPSDNDYIYYFDPCKRFTEKDCKSSYVCQVAKSGSNSFSIGNTTIEVTGNPESSNLVLKYKTPTAVERKSVLKVACANVDHDFHYLNEDTTTNIFTLELKTRWACRDVPHPESKGGLSTGSILVILFFVFAILYLVGGILFMKFVRRAEGAELMPNIEFWRELPGLIKDGFRFTCRGCKAESSYEKI